MAELKTRTNQPVTGELLDYIEQNGDTTEIGGNLYVDGNIETSEPVNIEDLFGSDFNSLEITVKGFNVVINGHKIPYTKEQVLNILTKYWLRGFVCVIYDGVISLSLKIGGYTPQGVFCRLEHTSLLGEYNDDDKIYIQINDTPSYSINYYFIEDDNNNVYICFAEY